MDLQTAINLLMIGTGMALIALGVNRLFTEAPKNAAQGRMKRALTQVAIGTPLLLAGTLITYFAFYRIAGLA